MDLVAFHHRLLGQDSTRTPKAFRIYPQQAQLYTKFPNCRGFSSKDLDEGLFLAALVLAVAQTDPDTDRRVFLVVPRSHMKWVWAQMEVTLRYMIHCRRRDPLGIAFVKEMSRQIFLCGTPLQMPGEPAWWATFGFHADDLVPDWVRKALIEVRDG